jgi:hypothetical protein
MFATGGHHRFAFSWKDRFTEIVGRGGVPKQLTG